MQSAQASRNVFDALTSEGHIFRNRSVLSSDYVPEDFPHRNDEIDQVAHILRPALEGSRPSNILIYGQTGTGKTAVARYICDQLKDKVTADGGAIHTAHINCKRVNTPYGILANIGQTYTTNWEDSIPHTGWRLEQVYAALCRKAEEAGGIALVVLDEVDALVKKSGDEVLYHLTGINADLGNARMSLIGISNDTKFTTFLDPRVKSRLGEESLTFPPYNALQLRDILDQRAGQAFHEGALDPQVLSLCAGRAAQEHGDARKALDLLRIAAEMAEREKPKLIIAGASAYSRHIDFARFREIADSVGAYLMVDMAHYAGLIAGGAHPSPVGLADIVTTTTHKTLRGPRGAMALMTKDLARKYNSAVFPNMQGGPMQHVIAAKAVAFREAMRPEFKDYAHQIVQNAKALASGLSAGGLRIVAGGTENHLMLVDTRPLGLTGRDAEAALIAAGLVVNKNAIPFDPEPPMVTSGVRIGTPALTSRQLNVTDMEQVAGYILEALRAHADESKLSKLGTEVAGFASKFPVPGLDS